LRLGSGGRGSSAVGYAAVSLGHAQWSMTHSHTRATSISWEKKRSETMVKPPHTADIEQVLREKKPFILRCMLDGIKKRQGRMVIWNRFTLSVSIT
jgi:hypothetical protein